MHVHLLGLDIHVHFPQIFFHWKIPPDISGSIHLYVFMGGLSMTENNCSNGFVYINGKECVQNPTAVNHPLYYLITPEVDNDTSIVIFLFYEAESVNNRKAIR